MMKIRKLLKISVVLLLFGALGFVRMWQWQESQKPIQTPLSGVLVEKRVSSKGQRVWVIKDAVSDQDVFIYTTFQPEFNYGDYLEVDGKLIENRIYYPTQIELKSNEKDLVMTVVSKIKKNLADTAARIFNERDAQLVTGVVFGFNEGIDSDFTEKLKRAGVMHVIVASGYNVAVIVGFLERMTAFTGRKIMLVLAIVGLVFYAALSGFNPPIVRASIMGLVGLVAMIIGRPKDTLLWLFYTAIFMILIDPPVVSSISFQLSFGATFGIVVLADRLNRLLGFLPKLVSESIATSVAAQVFTLPLIAVYFGIFNPFSVIANGLILWIVPLVMVGGVVAILVGMINPTIGMAVGFPIGILLQYFAVVVGVFG